MRKLSNKKNHSIFTILLLTLSTLNIVVYGTALQVETDKDEYLVGEYIVISCTAAAPSETVNILVKEGELAVFDTTVVVDEDGNINLSFLLTGLEPGEHIVEVQSASGQASTTFHIADNECKLAHNLLEILSMSREKTWVLLSDLLKDEQNQEEKWYETYVLAEKAYFEAQKLNDEGKCQESAVLATDALRLYGEALRFAESFKEKEPDDDPREKEIERRLMLKDVLDRLYCHLEKIRRTSDEFAEDGFDVSEVDELIERALEFLHRARGLLDEGKFDEVEVQASEVKHLLNLAMNLIQKLNEVNKIEKARRFLTETENRLDVMEGRITDVLSNLGVSVDILDAVGSVFQEAKLGIEEVKNLLDTGSLEEAITEFKAVFEEADEGLELVEEFDGNRREYLAVVEKLEAKICYLAGEIEALRESGIEVSGLIDMVEKAKMMIHMIVQNLEMGHLDDVEELIRNAHAIINHIEEELARFRKNIQTQDGTTVKAIEIVVGTNVDDTQTTDEFSLELRKFIDILEEKIHILKAKIERLSSEGHDVEEFKHILDKAIYTLRVALNHLSKGDQELTKMMLSELSELLEYLESRIWNLIKANQVDTQTSVVKPDSTVTIVTVEKPCNESDLIAYKTRIDEFEERLVYIAEIIDCLGETGTKLRAHHELAWKYFFEMLEKEPCTEAGITLMAELEELLSFMETKANILQEETNTANPDSVSSVDETPREVWYYSLEMGGELYGKFEFKVIKIIENDIHIVFEEGVVYDCFVEWILSSINETYEPLNGSITSMNWSEVKTTEWVFEGAIPVSWRGPDLDSITGEPHFIERLELVVARFDGS